jgi:hypothetical protein
MLAHSASVIVGHGVRQIPSTQGRPAMHGVAGQKGDGVHVGRQNWSSPQYVPAPHALEPPAQSARQRPSTQCPLAQPELVEHSPASDRQVPPAQRSPGAQSPSALQRPVHSLFRQTPDAHSRSNWQASSTLRQMPSMHWSVPLQSATERQDPVGCVTHVDRKSHQRPPLQAASLEQGFVTLQVPEAHSSPAGQSPCVRHDEGVSHEPARQISPAAQSADVVHGGRLSQVPSGRHVNPAGQSLSRSHSPPPVQIGQPGRKAKSGRARSTPRRVLIEATPSVRGWTRRTRPPALRSSCHGIRPEEPEDPADSACPP